MLEILSTTYSDLFESCVLNQFEGPKKKQIKKREGLFKEELRSLDSIIKEYGLLSRTLEKMMQDNSHLRNKYQVTKASLDQDFVNENYQIQNTRSESDTTVDEVDMLEQSLRV